MKRKALIIWGAVITGLLGVNILFTWVIWESGKVMFSQYVARGEIISEELEKFKQEMRILKAQVENQNSVTKKNSEIHKTDQLRENLTQSDINFKMFPNTQREGAYEFLVTNNKVVIARFHGLGVESHVIVPEKIQEMPVTIIGKWSFSRGIQKSGEKTPDNLVKVSLPETLEKIESGAFQRNYKLSEVNLPQNITLIEDSTFAFCGFTNLVLPNTVKKIGKRAFMANWKLNSVEIPSSVEFIGENAFSGCRNLKNIKISGTNTVIEPNAFQYCPNQPNNPHSAANPQ